jgi:hypothetical protein
MQYCWLNVLMHVAVQFYWISACVHENFDSSGCVHTHLHEPVYMQLSHVVGALDCTVVIRQLLMVTHVVVLHGITRYDSVMTYQHCSRDSKAFAMRLSTEVWLTLFECAVVTNV